jgi:hypothetical protein
MIWLHGIKWCLKISQKCAQQKKNLTCLLFIYLLRSCFFFEMKEIVRNAASCIMLHDNFLLCLCWNRYESKYYSICFLDRNSCMEMTFRIQMAHTVMMYARMQQIVIMDSPTIEILVYQAQKNHLWMINFSIFANRRWPETCMLSFSRSLQHTLWRNDYDALWQWKIAVYWRENFISLGCMCKC